MADAVQVGSLPGSEYNAYELSVWAVGGRRYVRKSFPPSAERRFLTERRAYELLAEAGGRSAPGMPAAPVADDPGRRELWIEYVDGVPLAEATRPPLAELGRAVGAYHRATATPGTSAYGSLPAPERRVPPEEYWLSHVEDLERACLRHGLPNAWIAAFRAAVAEGLAQDDGGECAMVHRDLRSDNILVGAGGEVRIIDWELAVMLHPAFDLARLFLSEGLREERARAEFREGYGRGFSEPVARMCEAALGAQLVAYADPDGRSRELYEQGVGLLAGAL